MIELIFILYLLFAIFLKRHFLLKLTLLALAGLAGLVLSQFQLSSFLPWLMVAGVVLILDYFLQDLLREEMRDLKSKFEQMQKDFSQSEKKLNEMDLLNRQLQQDVTKITKFFEISKELTKVMYFQQLPPVLANIVKEGFEVSSLGFLIFEDGDRYGIFIYPEKNKVDFREDVGFTLLDREKIIREEESGFYDGETLEPLLLELGYRVSKERIYIIPLLSEGRLNGLLLLENLREEKTDLAHTLAGFLSLTLRKVRLYEKIQELAITDELTQVFVRRHFLKMAREELARIKSQKGCACFLMLDLDRFKSCNDTFGHLVGDVVLKQTGEIIKQNIREVDIIGRYGGEEFCIFLPQARLDDGIYVAERIRKAVEKHIFHAYDEILHITVSIGISSYPSDAQDEQELIEKADLALYSAKRKGRNRVIAYSSVR